MKFVLRGPFKENAYNLMRKAGYRFLKKDKEEAELVFIRPLVKGVYPRFHLFLREENNNLVFNLHLDQKKPIYKGAPAHSGEYESEAVKKESKRIKQLIFR